MLAGARVPRVLPPYCKPAYFSSLVNFWEIHTQPGLMQTQRLYQQAWQLNYKGHTRHACASVGLGIGYEFIKARAR